MGSTKTERCPGIGKPVIYNDGGCPGCGRDAIKLMWQYYGRYRPVGHYPPHTREVPDDSR